MGYCSVPLFPLLPWSIETGIKHFPLNLSEPQSVLCVVLLSSKGRKTTEKVVLLCWRFHRHELVEPTRAGGCGVAAAAWLLAAHVQPLLRQHPEWARGGEQCWSVGVLLVSERRQKCCFPFLGGVGWGCGHRAIVRDQNSAKISHKYLLLCVYHVLVEITEQILILNQIWSSESSSTEFWGNICVPFLQVKSPTLLCWSCMLVALHLCVNCTCAEISYFNIFTTSVSLVYFECEIGLQNLLPTLYI